MAHAVARVAQDIGKHLQYSSLSRVRHFDAIGQPLQAWPRVGAFRQPDVARQLFPVANLTAGMGVGVVLAGAAGKRFAIEVLELRRQLADDVRFALRRQPSANGRSAARWNGSGRS